MFLLLEIKVRSYALVSHKFYRQYKASFLYAVPKIYCFTWGRMQVAKYKGYRPFHSIFKESKYLDRWTGTEQASLVQLCPVSSIVISTACFNCGGQIQKYKQTYLFSGGWNIRSTTFPASLGHNIYMHGDRIDVGYSTVVMRSMAVVTGNIRQFN